MPTMECNGTTIWYELEGNGPPALVVHGGLGLDHACYRDALRPLARHAQLVWYDQRGNGRSGRPDLATVTMEQLADDAAALVGELGFDRVHVIGHSYGGFVAQELALRHPGVVRSLVLLGTGPGQIGTTEPADADQGEPPPAEFIAVLSNVPQSDEEMQAAFPLIAGFWVHRCAVDDAIATFANTIFDSAVMARGFEVLAGWSAFDRLPQIDAPTLVVAGAHDIVTSPAQSRRITSQVRGARFELFEDSGHFLFLDEPERFTKIVGDWLDTQRR
jgi:proline iminopeptidase